MDKFRTQPPVFPILVVDDEVNNLEVFRLRFRRSFTIHTALGPQKALEWAASHGDPAVVVVDQRMPEITGIELLRKLSKKLTDMVGIVVTAYSDWDVLFEALNSGLVYRYLLKPWNAQEMEIALRQSLDRLALTQENRHLIQQLSRMNEYLEAEIKGGRLQTEILGAKRGLRDVMALAEQVSQSASTVLLRGESGTGKEVMARAIHEMSPRSSGPFVKISCAALAAGLLESELFGHEKGAFTGATQQRIGRFELASGGTLFLDEIGDVPLDIQVKLLRVLQEREFERVGGSRTVRVDVRVIAATHQNLEELIQKGVFREDLYYRLNVFPIYLPPLRHRKEDIPALVNGLIARFQPQARVRVRGVSERAMKLLTEYDWPGNVRELQNVIERAMLLCREEIIDIHVLHYGWSIPGIAAPSSPTPHAPKTSKTEPPTESPEANSTAAPPFPQQGPNAGPYDLHPPRPSDKKKKENQLKPSHSNEEASNESSHKDSFYQQVIALERQELKEALLKARGNKAKAARLLGISRTTFYYRLKKRGLWYTKDEDEAEEQDE